jgi:hypothetical protein
MSLPAAWLPYSIIAKPPVFFMFCTLYGRLGTYRAFPSYLHRDNNQYCELLILAMPKWLEPKLIGLTFGVRLDYNLQTKLNFHAN